MGGGAGAVQQQKRRAFTDLLQMPPQAAGLDEAACLTVRPILPISLQIKRPFGRHQTFSSKNVS